MRRRSRSEQPGPASPRAFRGPRAARVGTALAPWATGRTLVVLLAVTLYAVGAPVSVAVHGVPAELALVAVLLQCGGLVTAMWRAELGAGAALAGVVLVALGADPARGPWPWTVPSLLTFALVLGVLGARRLFRPAVTAWLGSLLVTIVLAWVLDNQDTDVSNLVVYTSNSALVLGAGCVVGARRRVREELARSRRDTELEQARRVVVEERNRIARELHDVVAHSMSVIGVQATTAPYRIPDLSPQARAEFDDIAAQSRTAMAEMRTLLGVLRNSADGAELSPRAGLDGLGDLAEGARRAGSSVALHVAETLQRRPVPSAVGVVVHRIVQEGLSNVVRHATGADVVVDVAVQVAGEGPVLVVEVRNGPAPQTGGTASVPADSGGHGLVGVRERASLLGGSVAAAPTDDGGFALRVELPWEGGA
ncbi:histidine kinase [Kineococcus sp. NPDC059986]|uniref:sensor histidine kinase n=1 Tax=Kineococcus sp. NPDC059986 TaxID=3155538 RepID=UPI00344DDD0D